MQYYFKQTQLNTMENLTPTPTQNVPQGTFTIDTKAHFFKDFEVSRPTAMYNLIVSIRDCRLYEKGIKPHRNWKITDVKKYFGIKGGAEALAYQLEWLRDSIIKHNN